MGARPRTDDDAEGNGTVGRVGEASLLTLGCRGENPGIFVSARWELDHSMLVRCSIMSRALDISARSSHASM